MTFPRLIIPALAAIFVWNFTRFVRGHRSSTFCFWAFRRWRSKVDDNLEYLAESQYLKRITTIEIINKCETQEPDNGGMRHSPFWRGWQNWNLSARNFPKVPETTLLNYWRPTDLIKHKAFVLFSLFPTPLEILPLPF